MRLFVAVSPGRRFTEELTSRLAEWTGRLDVRWTRPETWHLTLSFLGEWPADRAAPLIERLSAAIESEPLRLVPGPLAGFPDLRRPRVLFVQMEGGGQLAALAAQVRGAVDQAWPEGPQDRRPFRPHLTLARIRRPLTAGDINLLQDIDLSDLPQETVERVQLIRSELRPDGSRYFDHAVFGLRKKGE